MPADFPYWNIDPELLRRIQEFQRALQPMARQMQEATARMFDAVGPAAQEVARVNRELQNVVERSDVLEAVRRFQALGEQRNGKWR